MGSLINRLRDFWANLNPWVKLGAVGALVVAAGCYVARPAYRAFREYRIDRILAAAAADQAAGNWVQARDRARGVLYVRRGDLAALRIWFRAMRELGDPGRVDGAYGSFLHPKATLEDKAAALEVFADQGPHAVFLTTLFSLAADQRKQPLVLVPTIRFFVGRGRPAVALRLCDQAGAAAQSSPSVRVEKVRALCAEPTPERLAEARSVFLGLRDEPGPEPLQALRTLALAKGGLEATDGFPDLAQWIAGRADAGPTDHLCVVQQQLAARPAAAGPLVDEAVARYRAAAPAALGAWLLRQGHTAKAIDVLAEVAGGDADAFVARIHGLTQAGRIAEARDALAKPPDGLDRIRLHTEEATLEMAASDRPAAVKALRAALDEARSDNLTNRFFEVAACATTLGIEDLADEAMVNALRLGRGPIPLFDGVRSLLSKLARTGRTEDLMVISRVMLFYEPTNAALRNSFLYLACLHGVLPPAEASSRLAALAAERPELPEILGSLAVARLMAGQPAAAREALAQAGPVAGIPAHIRLAVAAATAALLGEAEPARDAIAEVNWKQLMPQEALVFRNLLAASKVASLPLPDLAPPPPSYAVEPLGEWQDAHRPKLRDLPPDKPVKPNFPVLDLKQWQELNRRRDEELRKAGREWMGEGKAGGATAPPNGE